MKKTNLLIGLITISIVLFFVASGKAQTKVVKTDVEKNDLKGRVKSYTKVCYKAIDKLEKIQKGEIAYQETSLYNEKGYRKSYTIDGKKQKECVYDGNGNKLEEFNYLSGELFSRHFYKYDNKGNQFEERAYRPDSSLEWVTVNTFDDKGNEIEAITHNSDGSLNDKTTITYDEKGNELESKSVDADGKVSFTESAKYDNKGNKIEYYIGNNWKYLYKYNDKGIMTERIETSYIWKYSSKNKYDEKGNVIEVLTYDKDGIMDQKSTYKYDEMGSQVEWDFSKYYPDGKLKEETVYKHSFIYDNIGNCIKETTSANGIVTGIIENEITYY